MQQPEPETRTPPSPPRRRARLWLYLLALAVVGVAAVRVAGVRAGGGVPDELRGDADSATVALEEAMARLPAEERLPTLLRYAVSEYPGLRYATIDELARADDPRAVDAVERAFTDSASQVRQRAVEVLPTMDRERGLRMLASALRDEDLWIREAAAAQASILAGRKEHGVDRRAVPVLVQALDDSSPAVCVLSMAALRKLTGRPWKVSSTAPEEERRPVVARWQAWWRTQKDGWDAPAPFANPPVVRPQRADPAPQFKLRDVDGKAFDLAGQAGRLTLINFWGTWCPPCAAEVADLARLDAGYRARGLDIVGIALSEPDGEEGLKRWCAQHGVTYRQALGTSAVTRAYGRIEAVPVSILVDRKGRIRYRWDGERDYATFRAAVDRLLAERG